MANRTKSIPTCIGENIRRFRLQVSLTQKELAEKLYRSESAVRMWELGKSEPDGDTLVNMANIFGVSVDHILGKEPSHLPPSNLSPLPQRGMRVLPVYETVSAGFGAQAEDCIIDYLPCFIISDSEAENSIAIKVKGDSMYPKIEDGDIIRVIKQNNADDGQIAVVLVDDEGFVKRVHYTADGIELQSINPLYPPMHFKATDTDRIRIVGIVRQIIKNV
jgi:repressor LexA